MLDVHRWVPITKAAQLVEVYLVVIPSPNCPRTSSGELCEHDVGEPSHLPLTVLALEHYELLQRVVVHNADIREPNSVVLELQVRGFLVQLLVDVLELIEFDGHS